MFKCSSVYFDFIAQYLMHWKWNGLNYLPVFVMIISVPSSWNLSHNSFVSRWQSIGNSWSQLHRGFTCEFDDDDVLEEFLVALRPLDVRRLTSSSSSSSSSSTSSSSCSSSASSTSTLASDTSASENSSTSTSFSTASSASLLELDSTFGCVSSLLTVVWDIRSEPICSQLDQIEYKINWLYIT